MKTIKFEEFLANETYVSEPTTLDLNEMCDKLCAAQQMCDKLCKTQETKDIPETPAHQKFKIKLVNGPSAVLQSRNGKEVTFLFGTEVEMQLSNVPFWYKGTFPGKVECVNFPGVIWEMPKPPATPGPVQKFAAPAFGGVGTVSLKRVGDEIVARQMFVEWKAKIE